MEKAKFSLVVLKTRQLEIMLRFYGSVGIEFAEEQHLRQMRSASAGDET